MLKIKHVGYLLVIFNFIIEQELDNDMRKCKEEFKEFERQDVKYREDFKHMNQKIKKLAEKVEKVWGRCSLLQLIIPTNGAPYSFVLNFLFQDSSKIEALEKECEESINMIPKLEDAIPRLQKSLLDEEKVLEEIKGSSKGGALSLVLVFWLNFVEAAMHQN